MARSKIAPFLLFLSALLPAFADQYDCYRTREDCLKDCDSQCCQHLSYDEKCLFLGYNSGSTKDAYSCKAAAECGPMYLIIGAIALIAIVVSGVLACCCLCRCCPLYKQRMIKRQNNLIRF